MRSAITAVALVAASAIGLTACSSGAAQDRSTTLTILTPASTVQIDPAASQNLATTSLSLIDRRLTTWKVVPGKDATVVPDLATDTGRSTDGGRTWTYTLKDGLRFSNGAPVTSQEVKYGIERSFSDQLTGGLSYHKALLTGGADYRGPFDGKRLASIETPDAKTIVFRLNKAFGDWPWIASMPAFTPVLQSNGAPATYAKRPITTGPYRVESIKDGTALTLTRNRYWSRRTDAIRTASADRVVFEESQNQTTTVQNLLTGSGEYADAFGAQYLGAADLSAATRNAQGRQRLATSAAGPLQYLAMNVRRGALRQPQVRRALQYAVDRRAYLIASGGSAAGVAATTLITPGIAGRQQYDLYPAGPSGDVVKAKALLQQAGVTSLKLTLLVQNDPASLAQAQAIQQALQRVDVAVTLKPEDSESFYADAGADTKAFDLALASWQPDFPSANANISPLFDSSQIGGGNFNISQYSVPAVDSAIARAQAETDPAAAQAQWAALDKRIMQDAPVVPLVYAKQSFLRGPGVGNFFIPSFPAYPDYRTVAVGG